MSPPLMTGSEGVGRGRFRGRAHIFTTIQNPRRKSALPTDTKMTRATESWRGVESTELGVELADAIGRLVVGIAAGRTPTVAREVGASDWSGGRAENEDSGVTVCRI